MVDILDSLQANSATWVTCLLVDRFELQVQSQVSRRRIAEEEAAALYTKTDELRTSLGCGGV